MKTAMQELIDYVDSIWSNEGWEETIKEKAKELLEKEKEQIMYSYTNGSQDMALEDKYEPLDYYNQTYNQNK